MKTETIREELKKYLNQNQLTQKAFAESIHTTQTKLSNYLNSKPGDYTWLEHTIRNILERNHNLNTIGMSILDSTKKNIKRVLQIVGSDENTKSFKFSEDDIWNEIDSFNYLKDFGIEVSIQNYSKSGLYTDTRDQVTVQIQVKEDVNYERIKTEFDRLM